MPSIWDRIRDGADTLLGVPTGGLLTDTERDFARRRGLLSAGNALLQSAQPPAPFQAPIGLGPAIGNALEAGQTGALKSVSESDALRARLAAQENAKRFQQIGQAYAGKSDPASLAAYARELAAGGFIEQAAKVASAIKDMQPSEGAKLIQTDLGDKIRYSDPVSGAVIMELPKGKAPGADALTVEQKASVTGQIRGQFNGEQTVQRAGVVATFYPQIEEGALHPSPAGDLGIVFGIMKLFDPSSSVKEGEQATAANAGGVPALIRSKWNELVGGGVLSQPLREDYLRQARNIVTTNQRQVGKLVKRYTGIAERNKLDANDVVYDPLEGVITETAKTTTETPKGTVTTTETVKSDVLEGFLPK